MGAYALGWIIDQVCFATISLGILIFFLLQYVRLRSRVSGQDPPIVRFLCKIGICVGALQILRALDPAGVNHILPSALASLISNEVGCFLFTGFAYLNYLTLTFNYRLSSSLEPPPKMLKISFIGIVSLQWLIGNIVSIVLWVAGKELIGYAIVLFWVGCIAMPLSLITLDVSIHFLKKLLYQSAAERAQMVLNREGSYGSLPETQAPRSNDSSFLPRTLSSSGRQVVSTTNALSSSSSSSASVASPSPSSPLAVDQSLTKEDSPLESKVVSYSPLPSSSLSGSSSASSSSETAAAPLPNPKLRRPSISKSSSISISSSVPPSRPTSPPDKRPSNVSSYPHHRTSLVFSNPMQPPPQKPELTVTKNKALRKLITLQIFSHGIGFVVIGLSIGYLVTIFRGDQVSQPEREEYVFWWTVFSHTENAFALVMLWYVWRPISYLICPKKGKSIISSIRPKFSRPSCLINPANNINTPFMPKDTPSIKKDSTSGTK